MRQLPFPILAVTEQTLRGHGACEEGIHEFLGLFGTRPAPLTARNLEAMEDAFPESVEWLLVALDVPAQSNCGAWGCCDNDALGYLTELEATGREALLVAG